MGAFDHLESGRGAAGNPFSDQPGTPPPALAGRDPQLRRLLDVMQRIEAGRNGGELFLPGPRGLGKTSLLVETAREAQARGITVVRAELARDGAEAASLLLSSLSEAVGRSGLAALVNRVSGVQLGPVGIELSGPVSSGPSSISHLLVEAAKACADEGGLLVLVDEAQEHPATAAAVVRAGHRASQDDLPYGSVLAGLPRTPRDVVAQVSYAERIPSLPLGSLEAADAYAAIAGPLAEEDIELAASRQPHVFTVTGGYPFFVQVLGHELWAAAHGTRKVSTSAWRHAAAETARRTDQWLAERFARVPASQQRYLHTANEVGWPASTGKIADRLDMEHASLSPTRAGLIDDGLLWVPRRGQVDLVIPPFSAWLDRHRPARPAP